MYKERDSGRANLKLLYIRDATSTAVKATTVENFEKGVHVFNFIFLLLFWYVHVIQLPSLKI